MPPNLINSSAVSSANYYLGKNQKNLQQSIKRLASGKKISGPGDDPGNLAVSMKLNAQLSRMSGLKNSVQNGISFLEVQDSALDTAGKILNRMAELKGMSISDPLKSAVDVESYNNEFRDLQAQLYDISQIEFNGVSLFARYTNEGSTSYNATGETWFDLNEWGLPSPLTDNYFDNTLTIQGSVESGVNISIHKSPFLSALTMRSSDFRSFNYIQGLAGNIAKPPLFVGPNFTLAVKSGESNYFLSLGHITNEFLDKAIQNISTLRAQNGATQSRLNFAADNLDSYETGLRSAIGRIEDVDIAEESSNLAKHSILTQASAAMVAQASQSTQSIMGPLLGN